MCDPVSIAIAVGSKLASGALQAEAAKKVQHARENVMQDTAADINGFTNTARQSYGTAATAAGPGGIQQGINDAVAARTADYQSAIPDPQKIVSDNSSDAAKKAIATALTGATAYSKNLAAKRAVSEGYGAASQRRNLTLNNTGQNIGIQDSFAKGRTNVANLQLLNANNAGRTDANLAGIVDALGTVGSAAAGASQGFGYSPDVKDWYSGTIKGATPGVIQNPSISGTQYLFK